MTIVLIIRCSMFINITYYCTGVEAGLSRVVNPCMILRYSYTVYVYKTCAWNLLSHVYTYAIQCCSMILSYALLNALTQEAFKVGCSLPLHGFLGRPRAPVCLCREAMQLQCWVHSQSAPPLGLTCCHNSFCFTMY